MNQLIQKLEKIVAETEDPNKKKAQEEEEKELDEFGRQKKKLGSIVRDVKKKIEERNLLLNKGNDTTQLGITIRSEISDFKKEIQELENLYIKQKEFLEEKKKKGKKIDEKIEEEIKNRGDIVETSWKHHKELRFLEKSTGKGKYHSSNFKRYTSATNENVPDSLPDIDDPKFEILRMNDNLLEDKLDIIHDGVKNIKDMAINFGNELELQERMTEDTIIHVEETTIVIENLNVRLKKQLDDIRTCDRFIIDFVCCVIVLAIIGYIYNHFG